MLFAYVIFAAGTLLATFCSAAPTLQSSARSLLSVHSPTDTTTLPESHIKALIAGIDIYGLIPEDYTHRNGSVYHFAAGTNASMWVRAQLDIDRSHSNISARQQYSGIGIGMWSRLQCNGDGYWQNNVEYGVDNSWAEGYNSVGISYRGLYANEQLDFSSWGSNSAGLCGTYLYSCFTGTNAGCYNSEEINCFRLWFWGEYGKVERAVKA